MLMMTVISLIISVLARFVSDRYDIYIGKVLEMLLHQTARPNTLCFRTFKLYTLGCEDVGHLVKHLVYLHVGYHVQLHVCQFFLSATMSATLLVNCPTR